MTKYLAPTNLVVYADDDPDDIELVEDAFRQFANNVDVATFADGSTALSYLRSLGDTDPLPCLIILDINMPVLNGKEVLVRLRQMDKFEGVPVVLFTTSSMPVDQSFAQQHNAGFVTKPLGFEQMEIITRQFIDHCAQEVQRKIRR
ncbi:response regulator [Flavisolibacter nicotianae]|uniref:response regulator n=1 Tax=Flavisolibacter nicotianae TaxID=2364882 RepID=UPI0013C43942|nr:response regulator [Flavisolibacter nicotianae]